MFWPPKDACSLKTDGQITVKPATVRDLGGIFFIAGLGTKILNTKHLLYFYHEIIFACSFLFDIDKLILLHDIALLFFRICCSIDVVRLRILFGRLAR